MLFDGRCYNGTVYLAGYVIELALKARICKLLDVQDYPETAALKSAFMVHKFDQLLFLAGLRDKLHKNEEVVANWSIIKPWVPELRYEPRSFSRVEALVTLRAVREPIKGVFPWIKKYW